MKDLPLNRSIWFGLVFVLGLASDLVSKSVVFERIGFPGESNAVFEGWCSFRLYTSVNQGALWGIGQGLTWLFAALSFVAVAGVLLWLFKYGAAKSLWLTIALAFILAGTTGNLFDRLGLHGLEVMGKPLLGVRDFLLFTFGTFHWPVFNFADVWLVIGASMLGIHSFKADQEAACQTLSHAELRSASDS